MMPSRSWHPRGWGHQGDTAAARGAAYGLSPPPTLQPPFFRASPWLNLAEIGGQGSPGAAPCMGEWCKAQDHMQISRKYISMAFGVY